MVGDITQDLRSGQTTQWTLGANLRHTPNLVTFIDYDEIRTERFPRRGHSQLLEYGFTYVLTPKYTMGLRQTLDLQAGTNRAVDFTIERKLPGWRLQVSGAF